MTPLASIFGPTTLAAQGVRRAIAAARGANPTANVAAPASASAAAASQPSDTLRISSPQTDSTGIAPVSENGGATKTSVEDVRRARDNNLEQFRDLIKRLFRERGIDNGRAIRLEATADGQVSVAGDHPQKDAIEQVFRDQPEARTLFATIAGQSSLLQAAETAAAFQQAYTADPVAAVKQFGDFTGGRRPNFSLSLDAGELAIQFN